MKKIGLFMKMTSFALVLLLAVPFSVMPQQIGEDTATQDPEKVYGPEELEQILAPIALYPDALLAQVLTAATYPLEVVQADRFMKENQGLKGEALLEAAKDKDWEPSVKAMLGFPDVLGMMDEQLDWTQKLGDAFLAQQGDCMDAVQRLRQRAYAQGNLATTEKQVIRVEPQTQIIIIEPASPEVVYVPVYDTAIIYGRWWYPAYPPYYFHPRRYSGISFFSGVFVGGFWGAWGAWGCNWHNRDVYIHDDHYNNFTRAFYARGDRYRTYRAGLRDQPRRYDSRRRRGTGLRTSFAPQPVATRIVSEADTGVGTQRAQTVLAGRRGKAEKTGSMGSAIDRFRRQQVSGLTVNPSATEIRAPHQAAASSPMIDPTASATTVHPKENSRQAVRTSGKNKKHQPGVIRSPVKNLKGSAADTAGKEPIATPDSVSDTGDHRDTEGSTGDAEAQESVKSSPSTRNAEVGTGDRNIAKRSSSISNRKKDDVRVSAVKNRGGRVNMKGHEQQANRQIFPSLKGADGLREGSITAVGR